MWHSACSAKERRVLMKTILLVEDGRFLRVINERALARAGYRVMTACDGEEALRLATESVPDLVLLDMLLPKVSGPEVLRSLRANSKTAQVPIIVLSSLPQSNEAQLKKDGATAYLDSRQVAIRDRKPWIPETNENTGVVINSTQLEF